jgi:hypothetical protein
MTTGVAAPGQVVEPGPRHVRGWVSVAGEVAEWGPLDDRRRVRIARRDAPPETGRKALIWRNRMFYALNLKPGAYTAVLEGAQGRSLGTADFEIKDDRDADTGSRKAGTVPFVRLDLPGVGLGASEPVGDDTKATPKPAKKKKRDTGAT